MDKHYYSEKLDDYLSNSLSEPEKRVFEQILQQDPVLMQDLTLQKETIHQLQALRKAQIKARLSSIDVQEGSRHQLTRWIWLSGAAAALLFGIFSLSFLRPLTHQSESTDIQLGNTTLGIQDNRMQKSEDTPKIIQEDTQSNIGVQENIKTQSSAVIRRVAYIPLVSSQKSKEKELVSDDSKQAEFLEEELVFYYPDEQERDNYTFEINKEHELKGVVDGNEELSSSLEQQLAQNQLRYQHYDEQLFTTINFKFSPISLAVGSQQKTFVYHEGYFYELLPNQYEQKIATKVHNHTLIDRLKVEIEKRAKK